MVIATFGPSTSWSGKTITFDDERFTLEGHGLILEADVLAYDRQGHLIWADAGLRAWVEQRARAPQAPRAVPMTPSTTPSAPRLPAGLEGMTPGDWVAVGGAIVMFFGTLTSDVTAIATLVALAVIAIVVVGAGVVPGVRSDLGGREPLVLICLGGLVLLFVVAEMVGWLGIWGADRGAFSGLGSVAVIVGGFLKMREPVTATPVVAFTTARATVTPQTMSNPSPPPVAQPAPVVSPHVPSQPPTVAPLVPSPATSAQVDLRSADTVEERPVQHAATEASPRGGDTIVVRPAHTTAQAAPQTSSVKTPASEEPPTSAPATVGASSGIPPTSIADEIAKLAALREKGLLTDEEFAAYKAKLMG